MIVAAAIGAGTLAAIKSGIKIVPTAAEVPAADGIALFTTIVANAAPIITNGPAFFKKLDKNGN